MIDTHTHLYFAEDYPEGCGAAVERSAAVGVGKMVFPAVGLDSMDAQLSLHKAYPELTRVGVGVHPEHIVSNDWRPMVDDMFARFEDENPVAVGEVGIDLYHDATHRIEQMDAFGYQADMALRMGLPLIIHCRSGLNETLHILNLLGGKLPGIIFHSFTSGSDDARSIMEAHPDALFGINGVVTFKNAPDLREAVKEIGVERIVLETDAPYLAPVPMRGRTNESTYLPYICEKVAEVCGLTPAEVEEITDRNAQILI